MDNNYLSIDLLHCIFIDYHPGNISKILCQVRNRELEWIQS